LRWRTPFLFASGLLVLGAVFIGVPRLLDQPGVEGGAAPAATAAGADAELTAPASPATGEVEAMAARERARADAQAALRRFVDLQRQLESAMQVGDWGNDLLVRARERAASGDEAFVGEAYEQATADYTAAGNDVEALIAEGQRILEQALVDGAAAVAARDATAAAAAFALAATVAPGDPRVVAGTARAALLPEINALMLEARNHELAGAWTPALESLRRVEKLDPATTDLAEALDRVVAGLGRSRLQDLVSTGFAHLDAGRHAEARAAFDEALRIDPTNAAARGALEQVARAVELNQLEHLQSRADRAFAEERWSDAEALYAEALALDPNLQFALSGRSAARAQQQADAALAAIIDDPDRLSSARAYADAEAALAAAEALEARGPQLQARVEQVRAVLETYARPVPVILRSDNRTRITVSSVGVLGAFEEKQLTLRPGAYTVVGSRDGCRDVRARIVVRPDMAPVDIRCTETL
jgi:tetratricopeptide (TPR) repeat protein